MAFFNNSNNSEEKGRAVKSNLGRQITSIEQAKKELFEKGEWQNTIPHIKKGAKEKKSFFGFYHIGENKGNPFFLKDDDITMEAYIGSTGTGKGVLIGNKAREAIEKRRGLIIVDPKGDGFLPQICKEALSEQGREEDLQVCFWNSNFGYNGINENDDYLDIANKMIDALGLEESDNPGVDYYRKNSRVLLKKVLNIFFNGDLGVVVKKDFIDILKHIRYLKEDLEKQTLYEKEIGKMRPNANLLSKYEKRFFNQELIDKIYWDTTTAETLDSLSKSLAEIAEGANIFSRYTLDGALYNGKVLYMRVDMLDSASLKVVKMMINDAIQQARKKKANTTIIADELSFYANKTISGALATVRSMGLKFILAFQDIGQLPIEVRAPILSNCNLKVFYKISDKETLEYVQKIGGNELITKYATSLNGESRISQDTEEFLNPTRIRALPRTETAIIVAEALSSPVFVRTCFVKVSQEFKWEKYYQPKKTSLSDIRERENLSIKKDNIEKYKISVTEKRLLENSDLFGLEYGCELI